MITNQVKGGIMIKESLRMLVEYPMVMELPIRNHLHDGKEANNKLGYLLD